MKNLDSEEQRYFQTQEKLKAISRIKAGESHFAVSHSLGVTGETLCEWISSLAPVDWNQGVKCGQSTDHDLLDRALYTWFIQQLGMDLRPTLDSLRKKAQVFSQRLYNGHIGIVTDAWLQKWQTRHSIKEKENLLPGELSEQDMEYILSKSADALQLLGPLKDKTKVLLECDYDLNKTIDEVLKCRKFDMMLEKTFKDLTLTVDQLEGEHQEVEESYENFRRFPMTFRVDMLNTFGREFGLINSTAAARYKPGRTQNGLTEHVNEVVHIGQKSLERQNLPPFGPVERKKVQPGMELYALKADLLGIWMRACVIEVVNSNSGELYRVRFKCSKKRTPVIRVLTAKHLAYTNPPSVTLPVGTRVIAQYQDEISVQLSAMYAGVISEPPKITNNQRYLIFFDDGYAQYVKHSEVCLVCESSKEVWRDIHQGSQEFIKNYIERYPERPMVKLQKKQVVKIEWNGSWWNATALKVDASLVQMSFDADKRTEWIYRGSTRLAPLYNELMAAEGNRLNGKVRRNHIHLKRKHQPYVEYTTGFDEPPEKLQDGGDDVRIPMARKHTKNTARKSTTMEPQNPQTHTPVRANQRLISQEGRTVTDTLVVSAPIPFKLHKCSSVCNAKEEMQVNKGGQNPLRIPMLCGWLREIIKQRTKRLVCYRAPCGRRMRDVRDVFKYLQRTKSKLSIDLFCFDFCVHTFSQFMPLKVFSYIKDITYGKELVPVCLVNSLSRDYPDPVAYSSKRFAGKGVVLNLDSEFLCGCDCVDDCQDKTRCQCQQLTVKATGACSSGKINPDAGYEYRRLNDPLFTGVYECNSRCKCKSSCLNRVVQNGLQIRLQVFKTEQRGWGIRCLDDLPLGMFICIYAGQLSNEEGAQDDGREFGDEYQAELDHIEVVETMKDGYESDVEDVGNSESEKEDMEEEEEEEAESKKSLTLPKTGYDSDADYDPHFPVAVGDNSRQKRRCNARNTSKDSRESEESSNTSSISEVVKNISQTKSQSSASDFGKTIDCETKDQCQDNHCDDCKMEEGESKLTLPEFCEKMTVLCNGFKEDNCKSEFKEEAKTDVIYEETKKLTNGEVKNEHKEHVVLTDAKVLDCAKNSELLKSILSRKNSFNNPPADQTSPKPKKEVETTDVLFSCNDVDMKTVPEPSCRKKASINSDADTKNLLDQSSRKKSSATTDSGNIKNKKSNEPEVKSKPLRSFFGEEYCYIMDAKNCGNIGRYLNHSCEPNVFVQNVFVDTHDLRFPWVAFFSSVYIRAGTELTWDYNYDVGSVPGKVLHCYCGSKECRRRLL